MHVILANPRGFCAGVNMAVEALEKALVAFGTPLYVFHEIVHNRPVVERFQGLGVVFVDSIEEVPEGGTVLYSAHGVSPVIREASARRKLRAIDATCPLVTKVHTEAIRYAKEGYTIILIGHEGHDEVVGTMGGAVHSILLVEDVHDVAALTVAGERELAYLTQTTERGRDDGHHRGPQGEVPRLSARRNPTSAMQRSNRQEAVGICRRSPRRAGAR